MQYGICNLSLIPLRMEPNDTSELVSQVFYGEHFKVIEKRKKWSKIRSAFDKYEGWIDNKQYIALSKEQYDSCETKFPLLTLDLADFVTNPDGQLIPIPQGAIISAIALIGDHHEGNTIEGKQSKGAIVPTAHTYLNAPYLWGGKTHFGIDCSGFTQMVYRLNGYAIKRDASQQAMHGEPLSFIEESEPGDLAFFDNEEGTITHVGIIMADNYIIHAHGHVRIDRLDHTGIYNSEKGVHTHKLRVIKRII